MKNLTDLMVRATLFSLVKKQQDEEHGIFPYHRRDGWYEVKLGDFYVNLGSEGSVEVLLRNIDTDLQKRGLIVRGIDVCPY